MADGTETQAARGSDKDYCSYWGVKPGPETDPDSSHHMSSRSTGSKDVPYVEQCSFCGWIDGEALQRYADAAIKRSGTQRGQRIAIASEIEPFAFVEVADHHTPLTLDEIMGQALGAASMCWETPEGAGVFDSTRAKAIWEALKAEVDRAISVETSEALEGAAKRIRNYMTNHFNDGTIDEAVLAVQAVPTMMRSFRYGGSF